MGDTVFSRIIQGQIPCHRIYEDDRVLAFLDAGPLSTGHTLVIPKESAPTLDELSDESAAAIGRVLPRICRAVMRATGATACNILQNNGPEAHQVVMHVHFHVIPRFADRQTGAGLEISWQPTELDPDTAGELASQIADLIQAD